MESRRSQDVVVPMWQNSSALIAALPFPAVIISADCKIRAANTAALNLFSIDAVGLHYLTVMRQPQVSNSIDEVISGASERRQAHLTERSLGVDTQWKMDIQLIADLPEAKGQRTVIVTFQDVSELMQASQIRRDFVANVSHELRTPLTAVLGFIETLRGAAKADANARERFLSIMEREANRMLQLVDGLLSLSRVERDERVRPNTTVSVAGLVDDVITSLEPITEQNGSKIILELSAEAHSLKGDPVQLGQLLRNMLHNALKYGGKGGDVHLKVSGPEYQNTLRGMGIAFHITDHGPGIAAHHIPRLTERFYRVDEHRSRDVGGSGLGLAIAKHIINRHRGRLAITSELGKGSTFTIILPV